MASNSETGHSKRPSPSTLKKICLLLEIPEMYLYLLSADESDVPANKKHLFKILYPNIETMIKQLWVEGGMN